MNNYRLVCENRAAVILYKTFITLQKGSIVILPTNSCPIITLVILKAKLIPKFVDVDNDGDVIINDLYEKINKYDVAVYIFINTFGENKKEKNKIFNYIKSISNKTIIIDDKCLCIPDLIRPYGYQDIILYSTGYSKYIDFGYGGYAYINEKIKYHENVERNEKDNSTFLMNTLLRFALKKKGYQYKDCNWLMISDFKYSQHEYFDKIKSSIDIVNSHKKTINTIYNEIIPCEVQTNKNTWRYTLNIENKIAAELFHLINATDEIFCSYHYPSLKNIFNNKYCTDEYNHCRKLNLFNDQRYTEEKTIKTSKLIKKYLYEK